MKLKVKSDSVKTDFVTNKKNKVWVQDEKGNKFETDSKNVFKFTGDKHWRFQEGGWNPQQEPSADFRLADSDDFFGFDSQTVETNMWEKVALVMMVLFAGYYIYQALTFIF